MEIGEQRVQAGTELGDFTKNFAKKYAGLAQSDFPCEVHFETRTKQ